MLDRAFAAAARGDLRVGVGSHNLFDIAWALALREAGHLHDAVEIEMLEGMAPAQARSVRAVAGSLLLYTPVVDDAEFAAAIAYLSRRLDENAADENFLRALFTITPGSAAWEGERAKFDAAVAARLTVPTAPRREPGPPHRTRRGRSGRRVRQRTRHGFHPRREPRVDRPPPRRRRASRASAAAHPHRRGRRRRRAAADAARAWGATTTRERRAVLTRCADVMAAHRGRTIAVMTHETGKTVREGDPEVSEGIDMARWAAAQTRVLDELAREGTVPAPRGVVAGCRAVELPVRDPGQRGALCAGRRQCRAAEARAGERRDRQSSSSASSTKRASRPTSCSSCAVPDDDVGRHLIIHDSIDTVVLTGAYDTAQMFLEWKPQLRLIAETSGKNALVITGGADLDLAIRDLVRSAFGHAGQKCSAASLAIVEGSLHDDGAVPRAPRRRGPQLPRRSGPGSRDDGRTGHRPTGRQAPPRPDATGLGRAMARRAEATRRVGPVVEPGRPRRSTGRIVVPPHRVLRACARRHPRPRPRRCARHPERHRVRTDRRPAQPRSRRDRALERAGRGRQRVREPPYDGRDRAAAAVRRLEAFVGRPGRQDRRPRRHPPLRAVHSGASNGPRSTRRCWARATSPDCAPSRTSCATGPSPRSSCAPLRPRPTSSCNSSSRRRASPASRSRSRATTTFARRVGTSGAQRLRALGPISDGLARACHRAGVTVDDTAVTASARVELPRWMHEQAISRTLHRHGRVPGRE